MEGTGMYACGESVFGEFFLRRGKDTTWQYVRLRLK
jgi:hypothetical protein